MKKLIDRAVELLYPRACPLCGDLLKQGRYVCEECLALIFPVAPPVCLRCGCEIMNAEEEFCEDCAKRHRSFVRGFPALNYVGEICGCTQAFKYKGKKNYAAFFADEICKRHGNAIKDIKPDALIPVPIHAKRKMRRGYNQAELLAGELSRRLDIPVDADLIVRSVNTLPQKELNVEERYLNLKKAFISADKIVEYKCVMLVDDIYTTGATIEACTNVLRESGVGSVFYTSICIGKGF